MKALKALVDFKFNTIQAGRIAMGNRIRAIASGRSDATPRELDILRRWSRTFEADEQQIDNDITELSASVPIIHEMTKVKGVGILYAARIASEIDITKCDTVSALWKRAGLGLGKYWVDSRGRVVAPEIGNQWVSRDGVMKREKVVVVPNPDWHLKTIRDRMVSGYLVSYSNALKTTMYNVAVSFLVTKSPYAVVYYDAKAGYESKWTAGHAHHAALRKMSKIFLSHLWEVWRLQEGLPIRRAYVQEQLGHTHIYKPEDFGWGKEKSRTRKRSNTTGLKK